MAFYINNSTYNFWFLNWHRLVCVSSTWANTAFSTKMILRTFQFYAVSFIFNSRENWSIWGCFYARLKIPYRKKWNLKYLKYDKDIKQNVEAEGDSNNYFCYFYYITPVAKILFLQERLTTRLCPSPNFKIFPKFLNLLFTRNFLFTTSMLCYALHKPELNL